MKAIVCEMCKSNDIVKQDGLYVCQNCGTKYTPDEATKLMVDISGSTVKIDTSDEIENLYTLARNARQENNAANAAKYYDMILLKKPNDWEAYFYSTYSKASDCKIGEMISYAQAVQNCFGTMVSQIGQDESIPFAARPEVFTVTVLECISLYKNFHYNAIHIYDEASSKDVYKGDLFDREEAFMVACGNIGNIAESVYEFYTGEGLECNNLKNAMLSSWKTAISFIEDLSTRFPTVNAYNIIQTYVDRVRKYETFYTSSIKEPSQTQQSGGCYIATCVYGSYDCPQVWTLRRFRDYTLDKTWYGRLFIKCYYAISPSLVSVFGETKTFRRFWKKHLDNLILKLKDNGVEDTYYEDKY